MDVELSHLYDLTVLRVDLDLRGMRLPDGTRGPAAVFEAWRGSEKPTVLARVPPPSPRLSDPPSADGGAAEFEIPHAIFTTPLLATSRGVPVWLDLPPSAGPLRTLPWEALLAPLDAPLLRLPSLTLPPRELAGAGLQVALVASSIGTEDFLEFADNIPRLVEVFQAVTTRPVVVHVFANQVYRQALRQKLGDRSEVKIHDGPAHGELELATYPGRAPDGVESRWLTWVYERLAGLAVDHVHFYCHGDVVLEDGSLAFASTPETSQDEYSCVGSPELLVALTGLGAWSVGFSAPSANMSPEAIRDVAYAVADARPGVIVVHEIAGDEGLRELRSVLSVVLGGSREPSPRVLATSLWIDPSRVDASGAPASGATAEPDPIWAPLLSAATGAALRAAETPAWIATTARVLEQAQAHWLASGSGGGQGNWQHQGVQALRIAADLLEEHVKSAGQSGSAEELPK